MGIVTAPALKDYCVDSDMKISEQGWHLKSFNNCLLLKLSTKTLEYLEKNVCMYLWQRRVSKEKKKRNRCIKTLSVV